MLDMKLLSQLQISKELKIGTSPQPWRYIMYHQVQYLVSYYSTYVEPICQVSHQKATVYKTKLI